MNTVTQEDAAKKLMGARRYIGTRINGDNWDRDANLKGLIYYGPHKEMPVQVAPDVERKRADKVMTAEEAKLALTDYIAYFGNCSIDAQAGTVTRIK